MERLERSCAAEREGDWIATGPADESRLGALRIEARFAAHGYEPHRHDTYSFGYTIAGVQSFDYRGARRDSVPGRALALHPDEVHDGRAGTEAGFRYRMIYVEPRIVAAALGSRASTLPFVPDGVSADRPLLAGYRKNKGRESRAERASASRRSLTPRARSASDAARTGSLR